MSKRSAPLQAKRQAALDRMAAINTLALDAQDDVLTAEQQTEYNQLKATVEQLDARIAEIDFQVETERASRAPTAVPDPSIRVHQRADDDPARGFETPRDFIMAVMKASRATSRDDLRDERLRPISLIGSDDDIAAGAMAFLLPRAFNPRFLAAVGSDEQGVYSDPHGGFLAREQVLPGILQLGMEDDPTAGRTQPIPMTAPTVKITARTDKDHSTSVSGGFTVSRKPETVAGDSSRGKLERIVLMASSLIGVAFETWELIQDSIVSFAAIIDAGMRDQFAHHMLGEKLRGLGGNEYLGVITDTGGATISVAREAASKIRGIDITNMTKRLWRRRNAIWIANHDTKGEISRLGLGVYDSGATPLSGAAILYRPSLAPGQPEILDGLPLFYSEYASQLGTAGDLVLSDWSQYLDGLYQPIQSAESMHVRFLNREQTFMLWLRNAGAPWWRSPLTPHKGTNTLAPFVILGAAA